MTGLDSLVKRNCKLFFKDKGMFFSSLITPLILLVLYATFLAKVYRDSFHAALPDGIQISQKVIDATVGGQLLAALLAVSCITVAFCSNMLMVQDKITGARKDFCMTPVKKSVLALGYYLSTLASTVFICLIAAAAGFLYLSFVGWYLNVGDIALILLDIFLLSMFGTVLSTIINLFLTSQGQISAVGTIVSAGYGFICGAYMPISNFSAGLQRVLSFLPGTYGTSLLKNHVLRGTFAEMKNVGFPTAVIDGIKESIDCKLSFFDHPVSHAAMYTVLIGATAALILLYLIISKCKKADK